MDKQMDSYMRETLGPFAPEGELATFSPVDAQMVAVREAMEDCFSRGVGVREGLAAEVKARTGFDLHEYMAAEQMDGGPPEPQGFSKVAFIRQIEAAMVERAFEERLRPQLDAPRLVEAVLSTGRTPRDAVAIAGEIIRGKRRGQRYSEPTVKWLRSPATWELLLRDYDGPKRSSKQIARFLRDTWHFPDSFDRKTVEAYMPSPNLAYSD